MERFEPSCKATLVRRNYITPGKRATAPLQRVFLDVGGPVSYHKGKAVHKYWLVIVDDYSRYRWVYLMQHKSDVNGFYREWKDWAENHLDFKVGAVRSDNGGEFTIDMLTSLHRATGADIELTAPYNPSQNKVAERSMGIQYYLMQFASYYSILTCGVLLWGGSQDRLQTQQLLAYVCK